MENRKIDLFISYSRDQHDKMYKFYQQTVMIFDVNIFLDPLNDDSSETEFTNIQNLLKTSRVLLCCLSKEYLNSKRYKLYIIEAFSNKIPILVFIFEKFKLQELNELFFTFEIACFSNFISCQNDEWIRDEHIYCKVINLIQNNIKFKFTLLIDTTSNENKKVTKKKKFNYKLAEVLTTNVQEKPICTISTDTLYKTEVINATKVIQTATILCIKVEDIFVKEDTNYSNQINISDPKAIKLRLFKSSNFLRTIFGFNRMIFVDSLERFILTSSYTHLLLSVDIHGNIIEKKNPKSLLKSPWSICYCRSKQQIFIGDNGCRCIFIFDVNLKYLNKIVENLLKNFYDLAYDEQNDNLYAVDLFEGVVACIDLKDNTLKNKIYLSSPAFVKVTLENIYVLCANDILFVLNKRKLDVVYTISLEKSRYLSGLFIDKYGRIYTTGHLIDNENNKSKEVYMHIIDYKLKSFTKSFNMTITQCNDFLLWKDRLVSINDTHFDIFDIELNI